MNFSTVPPCVSTIPFIRSKYRASSALSASGSVDDPSFVDPVTSQKTTVTVFRISRTGAATSSEEPHTSQKRAPSRLSAPQLAQTGTRRG
jgi:hypothetical protein